MPGIARSELTCSVEKHNGHASLLISTSREAESSPTEPLGRWAQAVGEGAKVQAAQAPVFATPEGVFKPSLRDIVDDTLHANSYRPGGGGHPSIGGVEPVASVRETAHNNKHNARVLRSEIPYGKATRRIKLPRSALVDESARCDAFLKDGVLRVSFVKVDEPEFKRVLVVQ